VIAIIVGVYYAKIGGSKTNIARTGDPAVQVGVPRGEAKAKEHFEKGVDYSLKKEFDKAIAEYLESLKYNPNVASVHSNLGFAYFDKGDIEMAVKEYKKAIELDPQHGNSYYGMALVHEKKSEKEDAIKNWEEFLKLTQPHSLWWNKAQERLKILKEGK
jgi:tetratricopeptide (TPR) repeat protein